jgi:hypothetical protein
MKTLILSHIEVVQIWFTICPHSLFTNRPSKDPRPLIREPLSIGDSGGRRSNPIVSAVYLAMCDSAGGAAAAVCGAG